MISLHKVIVIGCPGGGKSTFARALKEKTGLPLVHLDMLYWNADRTTVSKPVFRQRLQEAMAQDSWIIDGNYGGTMELRMEACDTVFFLDYPTEVCLKGVRQRQEQPRSDMPWVESAAEDEEFLEFIRQYQRESRPKVMALLEKYREKDIHIFTDRREADEYLAYDNI